MIKPIQKKMASNKLREGITLDELSSIISSHMQDSEVNTGKQKIDAFWQFKIDEVHAFFDSQPLYQRLQELKLALKSVGDVEVYENWVKKNNLDNESTSIQHKLKEDFFVEGIDLRFGFYERDQAHINKYLDLTFQQYFSGAFVHDFVHEIATTSIYLSIFIEYDILEPVISTFKYLSKKQSNQLEQALGEYLGDNFKAIYLCPANAPTKIKLRDNGDWVYLDKENISERNTGEFYKSDNRIRFVQHDLTDPNLPVHESSFDFVFYNCDWAENGITHKVAEKIVKPKGIVMTNDENNILDHTDLSLLGKYEFAGYQLLTKPQIGFLSNIKKLFSRNS